MTRSSSRWWQLSLQDGFELKGCISVSLVPKPHWGQFSMKFILLCETLDLSDNLYHTRKSSAVTTVDL